MRRGLCAPARPLHRRPILESLEDRYLLATAFVQTNLVSDISGVAKVTDPNLVNPWGLAYAPKGPFWVADNNAGVSTLYNGKGEIQPLVVAIPSPTDPTGGGTPTGIVFNGGPGFVVGANGASGPSPFVFVTEDGTIDGWSPGVDPTHAILAVDNSANPNPDNGAVYKGATLGKDPDGRTLLYVTNFRAGVIEVYDDHFRPTTVGGDFVDKKIPTGFAPFDVANLDGQLYVTYAKQNAEKHDDVAGPGNGFVDVFDTNGHLEKRLVQQGKLNSPWGLALAPDKFGKFGGDLLVGNFGDGHINAYDPDNGHFVGALTDVHGDPVVIGGLWGLKFGNGHKAGKTDQLFFTAGVGDEQHGLFGMLEAVNVTFPSIAIGPHTASTGPTASRSVALTGDELRTILIGLGLKPADAKETNPPAQPPNERPAGLHAEISVSSLQLLDRAFAHGMGHSARIAQTAAEDVVESLLDKVFDALGGH